MGRSATTPIALAASALTWRQRRARRARRPLSLRTSNIAPLTPNSPTPTITTHIRLVPGPVSAREEAALAHPATKPKTAVVVEVVNRAPYGAMLATVSGASLYTTTGSCTGGCLSIWPPLTMPKGTKIPSGVTGLGTAKLAHHHKQVTFDGKRLYSFYRDSGGDVTGNGVGGFMVASTP